MLRQWQQVRLLCQQIEGLLSLFVAVESRFTLPSHAASFLCMCLYLLSILGRGVCGGCMHRCSDFSVLISSDFYIF